MKKNILKNIVKIEKEAIDFGFIWPNNQAIIDQAISECKEIEIALNQNNSLENLKEEIGDLIHCAISLSIFNNLDPEEIFNIIEKKFSKRINNLKKIAKLKKLDSLHGKSAEFMLKLWDEAKKLN